MLAARALAACVRGARGFEPAAPVRRAACAALAAWQRREHVRAAPAGAPPASLYGSAQLHKAFDERFKRSGGRGGLRPGAFPRNDRAAADALSLKASLVAALGDARPPRGVRAKGAHRDDAVPRLVELLRGHDDAGGAAARTSRFSGFPQTT